MVHALSVLASEGIKNRDLWYPTILGVLVVVAAVGLFCGTVYMLLATNLGARLGFLVATAGLSGLLVLMSFLWLINPSPVNTLKGRIPHWVAVEAIESGDAARSKIPAVQQIDKNGRNSDEAEAANLKAATDEALVIPSNEGAGTTEVAATPKFAVYKDTSYYLVTKNQETGGGEIGSQFDVSFGDGWPWVHVSLHEPLYAVVTTCKTDPNLAATEVPFGAKPPTPKCADSSRQLLVLERDLGSLRVPPFVALLAFGTLFGLCLLGLHWRERDLQEQAKAAADEAEAITKAAADTTPEKV